MLKSILRSGAFQAVMGWLLGGYMALINRTTRWETRGLEHIEPIWSAGEGVIAAVWHARLMCGPSVWPKSAQTPGVLISRSRDGEFVARAAQHVGLTVLRGSSRNAKKSKEKGSSVAFRGMLGHIKSGGVMCLMPDGPRGPRQRARAGAVKLSQAGQAPIAPFAVGTTWRIQFNSWDRFMLPLPFSRGVIVWAPPIPAPARRASNAELEGVRKTLEDALNAAQREVDEAINAPHIEPAAEDDALRLDHIAPASPQHAVGVRTGEGSSPP